MNRRALFSFLAAAPVAVATGIAAEAGTAYDQRIDMAVQFERNGFEWLRQAYEKNIEVTERSFVFDFSVRFKNTKVLLQDFMSPTDLMFIANSGGEIQIQNKKTGRTAYAPLTPFSLA